MGGVMLRLLSTDFIGLNELKAAQWTEAGRLTVWGNRAIRLH